MITQEENGLNMRKCPRFEFCSIPKCPLDYFMKERTELPEDEKCPLVGNRTKRTSGIKSAKLKGISNFIPKINEVSDTN